MGIATEEILSQALELSPEARAFVAERLLESLDAAPGAALSPAWREEVGRRAQAVDAGQVELRDAADVFDEAFLALE